MSFLTVPGYGICLWLLVAPMVDALLVALPFSPTVPEWRYSFLLLMSRSLMTPMLGAFIALVLSMVLEHVRVLKILVAGGATGVIVLAGGIILLLIDSIGVSKIAPPEVVQPWGIAWVVAFAKLLLAGLVLVSLTLASMGRLKGRKDEVEVGSTLVTPA